jgi:hypothetical protein
VHVSGHRGCPFPPSGPTSHRNHPDWPATAAPCEMVMGYWYPRFCVARIMSNDTAAGALVSSTTKELKLHCGLKSEVRVQPSRGAVGSVMEYGASGVVAVMVPGILVGEAVVQVVWLVWVLMRALEQERGRGRLPLAVRETLGCEWLGPWVWEGGGGGGAYGLLGSMSEQYHVWERERAKEGRLREALVEML